MAQALSVASVACQNVDQNQYERELVSDIEIVIRASKRIEGILERDFGAEGRGLHEKLGSVEDGLPERLAARIRRIASIRNKVVHDDEYELDDIDAFVDSATTTIDDLERLAGTQAQQIITPPGDVAYTVRDPLLGSYVVRIETQDRKETVDESAPPSEYSEPLEWGFLWFVGAAILIVLLML